MKDNVKALAKKAAEATLAAEAHQFGEAARNVAESLSIIEHMEDCQADRKLRNEREKREEERAEERHQAAMKTAADSASIIENMDRQPEPKPAGTPKGEGKTTAAA